MDKIDFLVNEISGRRNKECYYMLSCAVHVAREFQPEEPEMKTVVSEVRRRTKKESDATVSKALSRAACDIWENGDREKLEKVFGRPLIERPSPKELIIRLAHASMAPVQYRGWEDINLQSYGISMERNNPKQYFEMGAISDNLDEITYLLETLKAHQSTLMELREKLLNQASQTDSSNKDN